MMNIYIANNRLSSPKILLICGIWLFSGFLMNKCACRKKMTIDIFVIFYHDILAMILFRILAKSACFLATEQKPCIFHG